MSKFWKMWALSGITGEYVDIDFNLWFIRGHLHIVYGKGEVCDNPHHTYWPSPPRFQ